MDESAEKINADGTQFASFLSFVLASHGSLENQEDDTGLISFTSYLERTFTAVTHATCSPYQKLFNEVTLNTIAENVTEDAYRIATRWIDQRSNEALGAVVLWALDCILNDLTDQKAGFGGSKSQVIMFLVISMVLYKKPDILISLLPMLREDSRYYGQDKLPVIVWMTIQASQADLTVGLYIWAREILPIMGIESNPSPQTTDLILHLVESILSAPNAEQILLAGVVSKGELLIPPSALNLLLHLTFPSTPVKGTDRFEAIFSTLQWIALADVPGNNQKMQLAIEVQDYAFKSIGGGNANLSERATRLFIWCLDVNPECFKLWDMIYEDNVEKSVVILKKIGKVLPRLDCYDDLRDTLASFRQKNDKALSHRMDDARKAIFIEANQQCLELLGGLSFRWRSQVTHLLKESIPYCCCIAFLACLKVFPLDGIALKF
ncbi:hypothetical protein ACH5RR_007540 [Cinchona calisaya]|uniref:Uncharacterized protein n=1 Tax=Cinchona calisaya TaxID=153742 RepID=A0ABD3ASM1_9GENT